MWKSCKELNNNNDNAYGFATKIWYRLYVSRKEERLLKNKQRIIYYSDQKQNRQHKDQLNSNNQEREIGRKTTVWILQVTSWGNFTREDLDMANKGETLRERLNLLWWLVGWFLWHINLCGLFNAKSIL